MPAKNAKTTSESDGFSAEERAAMKERAAELRAEGKKGAKKADGLQAILDRIAEMAPEDRALAERVHVTVTATAPELTPKTWYGMPAYANADGKVVVFFQDAGKSSDPAVTTQRAHIKQMRKAESRRGFPEGVRHLAEGAPSREGEDVRIGRQVV
jgi:uncharacterized protein YdhG (YjbR/CyaY superfamily)